MSAGRAACMNGHTCNGRNPEALAASTEDKMRESQLRAKQNCVNNNTQDGQTQNATVERLFLQCCAHLPCRNLYWATVGAHACGQKHVSVIGAAD